jgi:hypothetical protein
VKDEMIEEKPEEREGKVNIEETRSLIRYEGVEDTAGEWNYVESEGQKRVRKQVPKKEGGQK